MRTNPNIILSGNQMAAPQLPDVNAMMQTRTAGMENIYALEQQRAAQAQAAQKEQEAAAAEAMLPSVLAAYSDASDVGLDRATSLMPAEVRDTFAPFITRLKGIPDTATRKSILEAELAKDEAGRAVLGRIPTEIQRMNADIQRGQLDLSRAELAQRRAEAGRGPEPKFEIRETDIGLVRVNPQTGEVFPIGAPGAAGGGMPGPRAEPAPAPAAVAPISTQQPSNEKILQPKAKAGATDQTQEERRRAASVRYTDKNATRVAEIIGKNPAAFGQGADEFLLSIIPFDMGKDFLQFTQDADREQVYYRMTQIVATLLRLETGAAYTTPELVTESASFMPKYGDEPATARDKIDALQDRVTSAVGSTGRAWTPQDQAEYDAAMMALEAVKDRLYPAGGGGGAAEELPEGATTSNW
jgi:hypothetical protein